MRCHPPRGKPTATVLGWLRNGEKINTQVDTNFIVSSSGNLLVSQAKLTDTANYSCIAGNVARKRVSDPALLTVYSKSEYFNRENQIFELTVCLLFPFSITANELLGGHFNYLARSV